MKLVNKNAGSIEPTPEPLIVQWTKLLLAVAAILTATSELVTTLRHLLNF
jgi:hypothetical protein